MPLTRIQIEALETLADARDAESYVAGSTPFNVTGARYSADIDIFHDSAERVAGQADRDGATLANAGFSVSWLRRLPVIHSAVISKGGESTKLEWAADSDFRFFPAVKDPLFGFRLHPADLAVNKLFAAAGRSEPRDIYDLMIVNDKVAALSALIWAAVDRSPGFTPEGLVAEIRRNLIHPMSAWQQIAVNEPLEPATVTARVRAALDDAEAFARVMPTDKLGLLFLDRQGRIVRPDPERLDDYAAHKAERRGHWPGSAEIYAAMFARLYGT
jgi:hypothetical protein